MKLIILIFLILALKVYGAEIPIKLSPTVKKSSTNINPKASTNWSKIKDLFL